MKIDKKIVFALSEPLALVPRPYAGIASRLGMDESELLATIRGYQKAGIIRRVGVVLGHFRAGYKCNALVAWKVAPKDLSAVGKLMADFPQVTHCYSRKVFAQWPFNLYTMIHAGDKTELQLVIKAMADKSGVKQYKVQSTLKEFKKVKSDLKEILS